MTRDMTRVDAIKTRADRCILHSFRFTTPEHVVTSALWLGSLSGARLQQLLSNLAQSERLLAYYSIEFLKAKPPRCPPFPLSINQVTPCFAAIVAPSTTRTTRTTSHDLKQPAECGQSQRRCRCGDTNHVRLWCGPALEDSDSSGNCRPRNTKTYQIGTWRY